MKRKVILHICFCMVFMILSFYIISIFQQKVPCEDKERNETYSYFKIFLLFFHLVGTWVMMIFQLFTLVGILRYNSFDKEVTVKISPLLSPFICFRTVTRGNFPNLVRKNVELNRELCLRAGLRHFIIEVVTDQEIQMLDGAYIKQTVVPSSYITKSGALFKGRALQYAIEANVCALLDEDWVVHLDEETLLTRRSIYGIVNFVAENKHSLGQGLIIYAGAGVVNWMTTILDFWRIADDLGRLRLQLKCFHTLFNGWKGSYMVCKYGVERIVSFDNGMESSLSEDTFFAQNATSKGFTFDFIEGEMLEKSPFTLKDLFKQRRRWVQGNLLFVHSKRVCIRNRLFMGVPLYSSILLLIFGIMFSYSKFVIPWNLEYLYEIPSKFNISSSIYITLFGIVKSYTLYNGHGLKYLLICLVAVVPSIIFNGILHGLTMSSIIFLRRYHFYIVQKE